MRPLRPIAVLASMAALFASFPATAQDEGEHALAPGPWWASGDASGTATASAEGATITWTGDIPAQFEFAISERDGEGSGTAQGTWEHQGQAEMVLSSPGGPPPPSSRSKAVDNSAVTRHGFD